MKLFCIILALVACGHKDSGSKLDPAPDVQALYKDASNRLMGLVDNGWVVSRSSDGSPEHTGDSLIWSGIAMAVLPCDKAEPIEAALKDMIISTGGGLFRHPSLPDEISMDGAIGLYRGVAHRTSVCGSDWSEAMALHATLPDNRLNMASDVTLPPEFTYVRDLLVARSSGTGDPDLARLAALETEVAGWALGVITAKEACFRINIGYQTLRTVETLGIAVSKNSFCSATQAAHLAHVDHWCGRSRGEEWISNFKYDQWEYALQRCPGWETPDGNGMHTPGLDLIEMLKDTYNL